MWRLALILSLIPVCRSQFPRLCTTPASLSSKTCCPFWPGDGSVCGERSGRGQCLPAFDLRDPQPSFRDFHLSWPAAFYHRLCFCRPPFAGFDCGGCAPGYRGDGCRRWGVAVRRGIHELSSGEVRRFLEHLSRAKRSTSQRYVILVSRNASDPDGYAFRNASVYDVAVWMHYLATKSVGSDSGTNFAHMGAAFSVWHRRYLAYFEGELRDLSQDEDFALPFWDWTRSPSCDVCTDQLMGSSGPDGRLRAPSVFADWQTICTHDDSTEENLETICLDPLDKIRPLTRNPGGDHRAPRLPPASDIKKALLIHNYDNFPFNQYAIFSFRNVIEGYGNPSQPGARKLSLHNLVHLYLNGTISNVAEASNDPIFLLHHAFIDKIVEDWMRADPSRLDMYPHHPNVPLGHRRDDYMVPFFPLVRNIEYFKYSVNFGYTYSNSAYEREDLDSKPPVAN